MPPGTNLSEFPPKRKAAQLFLSSLLIASRCTEVESGGRMVDAILTQTLLPEMSREFLERAIAGTPVKKAGVGVKDSAFAYSFE